MEVQRSGLRRAIELAAGTFAVSVFVHFLWEMLQSFAYEMGPLGVNWVIAYHFLATLDDAGLMVALYAAGWALHRDPEWIARLGWKDVAWLAGLGVALAFAIETWALARGRWAYTAWMPVIPGLRVGLLPLLQLALLSPFILRVTARLFCAPAVARPGPSAERARPSDAPASPVRASRNDNGKADLRRTADRRASPPFMSVQASAKP